MKPRIIPILIIGVLLAIGLYLTSNWFITEKNRNDLVLHGNVDIRQVDLGFRVFGKIAQLNVDEGDVVKPGDVLALLDPIPLQENLAAARAAFNQAQASVHEQTALFADAKNLYNRQKGLLSTGATSHQTYDDALAQMKQTAARLKNAQAGLKQARANLAIAKTNLSDTKIIAPEAGVIMSRSREKGAIVPIGSAVYTLSLQQPVWVRAYVAEPDLGRIKPGMAAQVVTDTNSDQPFSGKIGFISPQAEFTPKNIETKELRTDLVYRIRIVVNDPESRLRQGMPVTVTIKTVG